MAHKINTKEESRRFIVGNNLNRVPEIFVGKTQLEVIHEFFETNKSDLYIIRDAEHSSSRYEYVSSFNECAEKIKLFSGRVIIAVSINSYKNKILLGAIEISGDNVRICATTDSALDHRTMYGGAEINIETDLFDSRLNNIPKFNDIYKYISDHNLFEYTVEFTIYDKPVGSNKENIIINEVRNY